MNRNSFLRTLGGLAALIPALKVKATTVESKPFAYIDSTDEWLPLEKFNVEVDGPQVELMSQSPVPGDIEWISTKECWIYNGAYWVHWTLDDL